MKRLRKRNRNFIAYKGFDTEIGNRLRAENELEIAREVTKEILYNGTFSWETHMVSKKIGYNTIYRSRCPHFYFAIVWM